MWMIPAVLIAGFFCGFINVIAGSGSLITLPLLVFLGLPANVANGTNRVAILLQNVVSVGAFRNKKVLDLREGTRLMVPAVVGGIVGAFIAVDLNDRMMRLSIALVMLAMLAVLLLKPAKWLESGRGEGLRAKMTWKEGFAMFAVGVYGGFIQAGVGIFLLGVLVLAAGFDLVRANAVKVLIILGFTVFALMVFVWHGLVDWGVGLVLAIGNMAGAWIGARTAVRRGAPFVRWVLIAVVALSAVKLLWDVVATG